MQLNSKFEPLQRVWPIRHDNGKWQIGYPLTIGMIQITYIAEQAGIPGQSMFDNMGPQQESTKEEYMCIETGIESGFNYDSDCLFASVEEARAECCKRNEEVY